MTIVASNSLTLSKVSDGVGVTSTVITYANSTSGTTAPTTGWTSSIPSPVKGQYLWTKTVWTSTDTSTKTAYSVSYNSKDGTDGTNGTSGIIVSSVAPDSPQTGQLWQDTSTTPQLVKKWTGSEWVIWELYVENMNVNNLSALSPNLGNITGGSYTSWSSETVNGILYLNGIYLYNGRIRSLNIQAPSSIDPDKKEQLSGKKCRGTEVYSGDTHLFDSVIPQLSTASPNDILKGNEFWDKTSIFTYCGKISGYRTGGIPHTKYSSQHHIFEGTLQAKSMSGNVGGIVLSQGSFPVNVTPNISLKTAWGDEYSSLKLYGQLIGRRQFTLEINMARTQGLPNPDIAYRQYTASAIIGSLGEGVTNREWMVVAGINGTRNDLLFRTYYRDGNGSWIESTSTASYIYLIVPMIY